MGVGEQQPLVSVVDACACCEGLCDCRITEELSGARIASCVAGAPEHVTLPAGAERIGAGKRSYTRHLHLTPPAERGHRSVPPDRFRRVSPKSCCGVNPHYLTSHPGCGCAAKVCVVRCRIGPTGTVKMSTVVFDLRHPGLVAHEIASANQRLALEREVPASIRGLIEDLADALEDSDPDEMGADPYLL